MRAVHVFDADDPSWQPRTLNSFSKTCYLRAVKYVITLHNSTKSLLPRLPHLLIAVR